MIEERRSSREDRINRLCASHNRLARGRFAAYRQLLLPNPGYFRFARHSVIDAPDSGNATRGGEVHIYCYRLLASLGQVTLEGLSQRRRIPYRIETPDNDVAS